jgi:hypothetical protein
MTDETTVPTPVVEEETPATEAVEETAEEAKEETPA